MSFLLDVSPGSAPRLNVQWAADVRFARLGRRLETAKTLSAIRPFQYLPHRPGLSPSYRQAIMMATYFIIFLGALQPIREIVFMRQFLFWESTSSKQIYQATSNHHQTAKKETLQDHPTAQKNDTFPSAQLAHQLDPADFRNRSRMTPENSTLFEPPHAGSLRDNF